MKRRAWLVGSVLTVAAAGMLPPVLAPAAPEGIPPDAVIARVGTDTVTRRALETQLLTYSGKLALEQLIDRTVVGLEADRYKVAVTDKAVQLKAESLKASVGNFAAMLSTAGIDEATWLENVRAGVRAEQLLDKKWPVQDDDLTRVSVRYARLRSEKAGREVIADAKRGVSFELTVLQRSEDKENAGLIQPDPFLRIDNPVFFRLGHDSGLRVGQVSPQPIDSNGYWLVIKLEKLLPASTLRTAEREIAVQRIRAYRMRALVPTSRKHYKVEYPLALTSLKPEDKRDENAVVARLTFLSRAPSPPVPITRKMLDLYLLQNFGKVALEQQIERRMVAQDAAKYRVTLTDAEVNARVAAVQKANKSAFQTGLEREGITEDAWRERVRYTYLAEKVLNARTPVTDEDLERLSARYLRVATKQEAEGLISALQSGSKWEDVRAKTLDRTSDGFVQPKMFMRSENPVVFNAIPAAARPGQVMPQPIQVGGYWFVLRLENRSDAASLTPQERDAAIRQINTGRLGDLLDSLRKFYRPEYVVPLKTLIAEAQS